MQSLFQSLGVVPPGLRVPLLVVGGIGLAIAVGGTWARIRLWGLGRRDRADPLGSASMGRLLWLSVTKLFSPDCLFARRVFARSRWRGWMVVAFVWGSLAIVLAVLLSAAFFVAQRAVPAVMDFWASPVLDVAGLMLLLGLLAALVRRYLLPPERWISVSGDGVVLAILAISVASGLLLEGLRLAGTGWQAGLRWPVGTAVAQGLDWTQWPRQVWDRLYPAMYLIHAGSGIGLVAYLPFSKLIHVFASQITTFAAGRASSQARP